MGRQMEMSVAKERARIVISPASLQVRGDDEEIRYVLTAGIDVRNTGHSTAYIACSKGWFMVVEPSNNLPETGRSLTADMPDTIITARPDPTHMEIWCEDGPDSLRELAAQKKVTGPSNRDSTP
jgi:hypothetical protein